MVGVSIAAETGCKLPAVEAGGESGAGVPTEDEDEGEEERVLAVEAAGE